MSESRPKIVLTHWVHPEVLDHIRRFAEPVPNETRASLPAEELRRRCREAEGLMVFMPDRIDEAFLDDCPRLRVVAAALKGYDNFDVAACTRRGVLFTIVPDLLTVPTAELAVGLTLGVARRLVAGDALIRRGGFEGWRPVLYGTGLRGATVGIVGFGAVGRACARRLEGFDCRLIAHDAAPIPADLKSRLGVEEVSFDRLVSEADVVALFLPLTESTRHLFGPETLAMMKPGACLVNVCRGSVVDEEAVADAIDSGHLGGYAADVFEMEDWALEDRPRSVSPRLLENRERTFFTPHLGSAVDEVRKMIAMEAARQLEAAFSGHTPEHALNAPEPAAVS